MTYFDNTGLLRKFGTEQTVPNIAGEYTRKGGLLSEIEFKVTLASLTQAETILSDVQVIPSGARIVEVEVLVQTAAATGTAIDVGLTRTDRTTEIDFDGLLAAYVTANMNTAGERSIIRKDVTVPTGLAGTGALIGTTTSNVGYVSASMTDATAFTAGIVFITIRYYMP